MEQKQSARDDNESGRFETDGQIHFHSATNWPYEKKINLDFFRGASPL